MDTYSNHYKIILEKSLLVFNKRLTENYVKLESQNFSSLEMAEVQTSIPMSIFPIVSSSN